MKNIYLYITTILLLIGCNTKPKDLSNYLVKVSTFKINETILNQGDYVEILGCSGNLTNKHKLEFYNLFIVRSVKTGDTINVLATNFYLAKEQYQKTRFISPNSVMSKIVSLDNYKDLDGVNLNELKTPKFDKVLYDREYIKTNVKKYPAIIGALGDYTGEISK